MLTEAGFAEPTFHGWTGYFTSPYTQGGLISARKPGGETADEVVGMAGTGDGDATSS
jgi:hypothetical protein